MLNIVLTLVGILSLVLGIIGIVLPVVPTTPFLLVAAACFCRSSPRLYRWLLENRWFGHYIKTYREERAIPRRAKIVALLLLWPAIGYVVIAIIKSLLVDLALLAIGTVVSVYILSLKTQAPETDPND